MTSKTSRLDTITPRKLIRSENLRSQIVELAGKNSAIEGKKQNDPNRTLKDSGSPNSRRSDTSLGFYEDKKQSSGHSILHRKKEIINLHFTSIKKETKDENKTLNVQRREELPMKDKPSTVLLNRRKSRLSSIYDQNGTTTHEEVKNLRGINEESPTYRWAPSPQKEAKAQANSARLRQLSSSVLDHANVADIKHGDDRKTKYDRSQMKSRIATPSKRDVSPKCEIKGNAVPTPPQYPNSSYTLSSKRAGLFTASLAAFKRRLRLSSKKFTARLQDDSSTKDDEYFITVDDANMLPGDCEVTKKSLFHIEDHPFIKSRKMIPPSQHTSEEPRTPMFPSTAKLTDALVKHGGSGKPMSEGSNTEDGDHENDESKCRQGYTQETVHRNLQEQLPAVNNAKTYVLETDQAAVVKSEFSHPIPLTTHNLRLHESLLSMRSRRARRLERVRRAYRDSNNPDDSRLIDYGSPTQRIQKWLQNVELPQQVEQKFSEPESAQEVLLRQQCSTQSGLDLQQAHKIMIYA